MNNSVTTLGFPNIQPFEHIYIADLLPENEKLETDYLMSEIDFCILTLFQEKYDVVKAKRFYDGLRDEQEYAYLQENYGIGNAIKLDFKPIVRPHIQAIKGLKLTDPLKFHAVANSPTTINKIQEEKKKSLLDDVFAKIEKFNKKEQSEEEIDSFVDKMVDELKEIYDNTWQSSIVMACQKLVRWYIIHKDLDLRNKIAKTIEDLCVTGYCYYRVHIPEIGRTPEVEIINPLNLFYQKNYNDPFVNSVNRIVKREFMTKKDILNKYGHLLKQDEKDALFNNYNITHSGAAINSGYEIPYAKFRYNYQFGENYLYHNFEVVEVFHVEWIVNNEVVITDPVIINNLATVEEKKENPKQIIRQRKDRYEGYRIGNNIYFGMGRSKNVVRPLDNPFHCTVSYNGISYQEDNNGVPYSLILKTKDIQDKYDILHYFRDNLIAQSGTKGSRINISGIPKFLDDDPTMRILKFISYKKQGNELYDPSQEGFTDFNHYGDYNNSIDGASLEAINATITMLEKEVTMHTGVTPQMLAQIEQREAVSNVVQSLKQSTYLIKPLYELHNTFVRHMLTDLVEASRISFENGIQGSMILPTGTQELFSISPNTASLLSFDIHIVDRTEDEIEMMTLKKLVESMVQSGGVDTSLILLISSSTSIAEAQRKVMKHANELKALRQQNAQYEQQMAELEKVMKELQSKVKQSDENKMKFDMEKLEHAKISKDKELDLKERELDLKQENNRLKQELDKARVELEKAQLLLGTGRQKEIKND
jgi:hypothetical protein